MVTDFSNYTGQRSITFNGKNSLTDFGVLMHKATEYPTVKPRIVKEAIPNRNGDMDFSTISGNYYFEDRELSIVFLILAETNAEVLEKISALNNWLYEVTDKKLYDSDIVGYCFTNVVCTKTYTEALIKGGVPVIGFRAEFSAAPYLESTTGTRDQIITFAGKNITAHILKNAVLCTTYTNYGASDMTVSVDGTTMTLTKSIDAQYAGLQCFEIAGEVDFTLTGGYIGGRSVTLAGASHGYVDIPSGGGTLTLTAELEEEPSSIPYMIGTFASGIAFTHDAQKKYRFDDYAVGTHVLTVNGTTKPFSGFTIEGVYDTLAIVGARETDVYKLWYDSVEVSL